MKRVILVVIGICFLAGVGIITTGELQSQELQNEEKIKQEIFQMFLRFYCEHKNNHLVYIKILLFEHTTR